MEIPFELVISRLCEKFHKLPSEILNEDWEWTQILMVTDKIDKEKTKIGGNINQLKKKNGR